jgi:hypothetical protein
MPYEDPEKAKEYKHKHYLLNKEKYNAANSLWAKTNRKKDQELKQLSRLRYPEKARARNLVAKAIQRGDLISINKCLCNDCQTQAKHYHHEDYTKPLEVIALCTSCHSKRHSLKSRT